MLTKPPIVDKLPNFMSTFNCDSISRRYPRKSRDLFRLLMKLRKSSFTALISTVLLTDGEGVVPPVALA